jgi:hypothetical protein
MSRLVNFAFEMIYYLLTGIIVTILVSAACVSLIKRRRLADSIFRNQALGIGLTAIGAATTVFTGVSLDTLFKSGSIGGLFYQQSHFLIFYAGFALIFYGLATVLLGPKDPHFLFVEKRKEFRILLWSVFALSVLVSLSYLLNPLIIYSGGVEHVPQQTIYFLPLFVTAVLGSVLVPLSILEKERASRRIDMWFGAFSIFTLIGVLREATLIPSSGNPLVNLLVAFGPFTIAAVCLLAPSHSGSSEQFEKERKQQFPRAGA